MANILDTNLDLKNVSPLTMAFLGDGVYELLVREYIVGKGNCPVKKLNSAKVDMVRCEFQAKVLHEVLEPIFTEDEMDICHRGRNAHVGHVPKNSTVADYHAATAFETVFGYLYLKGDMDRIKVLFNEITKSI